MLLRRAVFINDENEYGCRLACARANMFFTLTPFGQLRQAGGTDVNVKRISGVEHRAQDVDRSDKYTW
jgi:hypothetical protein